MASELWPMLEAAGVSVALNVAATALAIVLVTHIGVRMFASSVARRTAWQTAIVATLGCAALEFSGIGQATVATLEVIADSSDSPSGSPDHNNSEVDSDNHTATPAAAITLPEQRGFAPTVLVPDPIYVSERYDEAYLDDSAELDRAYGSPSLDAAVATKPPHSLLTVSDQPAELTASTEAVPTHAATSYAEAESAQVDKATTSRWVPAVLATVWCLGSLWLLGRMVAGSYAIRTLARRLPQHLEGDEETEQDVLELATLIGLRRGVRLVTLADGCSPIAFGLWRPTIGLPADFAKRFTAPQRRAILAHELEHLAAGDPCWRLLSDLLTAALWWHPAVWSMRRQLIVESEQVADEASRAIPGGPEELAAALVVLGKRMARRRHASPAYGAEGDFRSSLGQRVERLLAECDQPWRPFSRSWLAVARTACGVMTIVCVISLGYWTRHHLSSTQGEVQMKTFMSTWRQSLAGVTLAMLASGPAPADTPATAVDANVVADVLADSVVAEAMVAVLQEEGERREEGERQSDERPDREGERDAVRERRIEGREERRETREERREGDRPDPDRPNAERGEARRREAQEIKGQVERLQNRLRELGDKNPDESRELTQQVERLMSRIRELRMAEANRPGREGPGRERPDREQPDRERPDRERPDRERPEADQPDRERPNAERAEARRREAQEIKGQVERLQNRLRELGDKNPDQSRELAQQVERLMNRIGELRRAEADRPGREEPTRGRSDRERPDGDRPDRERPVRELPDRERPGADRPDAERPSSERREGDEPRRPIVDRETMRGRFLKSAIDNLRAGGMHEDGNRLERENIDLLRRVDRRRPDYIGDREPRADREERPGRRAEERPRDDRPRDDRPRDDRPREERPRDGDRRPDRPDGPPRDGDRPPPGRPAFEQRPDGDHPERNRPEERRRDADRPERDRPDTDRPGRTADEERAQRDASASVVHEAIKQREAEMAKAELANQVILKYLKAKEQVARKQLESYKDAQRKVPDSIPRGDIVEAEVELADVQLAILAEQAKLEVLLRKMEIHKGKLQLPSSDANPKNAHGAISDTEVAAPKSQLGRRDLEIRTHEQLLERERALQKDTVLEAEHKVADAKREEQGRAEMRKAAELDRMKIELQNALSDREQAAAVAAQAEAVQQELQNERTALRVEVEKLRAHLSERDAEMQRKLQELQTREQQSRAELEKQKSWTVAAAGDDAARAELAKAVAERGRIELELSTVRSPEAREARMAEFRAVDEKINQLTRQLDAKNARIREEIAREIFRDPNEEMKEEIKAERAKLVAERQGASEQVSTLKAALKKFSAEKAALEADGAPAEVLAAKEAEVGQMREVLEQLKMQEKAKDGEIDAFDYKVLTGQHRRQ